MWQMSPPPFTPFVIKANFAALGFLDQFKTVDIVREGVLGVMQNENSAFGRTALKEEDHEAVHTKLVSSATEAAFVRPHAFLFQPVFRETYNDTSDIVGTVNALVSWDRYFVNLLPDGVKGITCVLKNTCGQSFTYYLDGNTVSCWPFANDRCHHLLIIGTKLTSFLIFSAGVLCWRG
jgi:hypothetical protein